VSTDFSFYYTLTAVADTVHDGLLALVQCIMSPDTKQQHTHQPDENHLDHTLWHTSVYTSQKM